jgi:hypothetical protein
MAVENPTAAVDVDIDEALGEGIDQPRPRPGAAQREEGQPIESGPEVEAAKQQAEEDLETLAPKAATREWTFGQGDSAHTYYQRELSVIGKAQFFALVGEILDEALGGENKLSLNALLAPPQRSQPGQFQVSDFQDADTFIHALGKLLIYSPKFIHKSVCIWLSVPDYEWELVKLLMEQSPEVGGMSDEMFEEILATFIDQNIVAINGFFRQRFRRLRARYQARTAEANQSPSSKHSRTTADSTQSA